MKFSDQEIVWACKMFLLDQLQNNKILNESLSFAEREKFSEFIKNLNFEQTEVIFEDVIDWVLTAPESEILEKFKSIAKGATIRAGIGLSALAIIGYLLYRKYRDKCKVACKTSTDPECINKCRKTAAETAISKLEDVKSKCSDAKCVKKIEDQITKLKRKAGI